jgi:hypothetical protein
MAGPRSIPFDLAAASADANWRETFEWPLDHLSIYEPTMGLVRRLIEGFDQMPAGSMRDIVTVCMPRLTATVVTLLETSLWVEAAARSGQVLTGGPPQVYYLQGMAAPDHGQFTRASEARKTRLSFPFLRQVVRVKTWTPWLQMPLALIAPQTVAIAHNSLMRAEARNSRVGYRHAELMLTVDDNEKPRMDLFEAVAAQFRSELLAHKVLDEERGHMVADLWESLCLPDFLEAQRFVSAAGRLRTVPATLWGGTGGFRPGRAVRVEARNRGSKVVAFDHGASTGMIKERESLVLGELCVADEYVVATEAQELLIRGAEPKPLMPRTGEAALRHGSGDPAMAWTLPAASRAPRGHPRVLYVSGAFIGFRQRIPPRIPDVVKLDWQIRLISQLEDLDVELRTQMHPGGILHGRPHPAASFGTPSGTKFENAASWAEVFLFDVVQSTTFALALTTDRPIVLIDHGMNRFSNGMRKMLDERCTILEVSRDERNRIVIDKGELADAINAAAATRPDAMPFRSMFAGVFA